MCGLLLSQWRAWTGSNLFASVPNLGDYYENAYPRSDSLLADVHGSCRHLSCISHLSSGRSRHVSYTGNPFTFATGPYTTSDFVTAMITLAGPLGANMPLTEVTPIAFTLSDGVQTITNNGPGFVFFTSFLFATDASGTISMWSVVVETIHNGTTGAIVTNNDPTDIHDSGIVIPEGGPFVFGANELNPGVWSATSAVPDAGSTLSLMTLTLMALGLAARRFQRGAA